MRDRDELVTLVDEITDPILNTIAKQMMKESDKLLKDFADDARKNRKVDWFESEEELRLFVDRNKQKKTLEQ